MNWSGSSQPKLQNSTVSSETEISETLLGLRQNLLVWGAAVFFIHYISDQAAP